jgi:hypothetical protein
MVAIPAITEEDAKRPGRERQSLVGEESRIVNRMKATLARLGIRGFNPKLKKAADRVDGLRTPEGKPIPPNTLAELHQNQRPPPALYPLSWRRVQARRPVRAPPTPTTQSSHCRWCHQRAYGWA